MSEFTIVDRVLNMYYAIYSARSLYHLMSIYLENSKYSEYLEHGQKSKMERFRNIILDFHYFYKNKNSVVNV